MSITITRVNIGMEIEKRITELNMTKTDFAKKLGIRQQHVNALLEKPDINTARLAKICEILDFDFFALYSPKTPNINAYLSALTLGSGDANNNIGDAALQAQLAICMNDVKNLKALNETLTNNLHDKERIIRILSKDNDIPDL